MRVRDIEYAFKRYALHERGMRPKSYRSIMASVNMLSDWVQNDDLRNLDHGTVREFLYWGKEERAWEPKTFRNHRQYLYLFFAWCVKQQYLKRNPVEGIEKPKLPQKLPRCISREQVQSVLNHARWYEWRYELEGIRNEAMLMMFIFTGLRLQELLNLELSDVNLEAGEILVRQGKGQKDRIVPVHPRLTAVLRNYLAERRSRKNYSQYFFTGAQSEKQMSGKDVRTICQKLSRSTDCYFTPHMLRHTFGKLAVEAGMDIFKIKEIMGHSEITTTQGYLSVSSEILKRNMSDLRLI